MFGQTFKYFATNVRAGTACFGEEFGIGWYCLHMARYWLVLPEHISGGLSGLLAKFAQPWFIFSCQVVKFSIHRDCVAGLCSPTEAQNPVGACDFLLLETPHQLYSILGMSPVYGSA